MSTNKSISYILCNKGKIINLYKLYFPSFPFSLQTKQKNFLPSYFSSPQPNTRERKLNIFYSLTFSFSHFSTPLTKRTLSEMKFENIILFLYYFIV